MPVIHLHLIDPSAKTRGLQAQLEGKVRLAETLIRELRQASSSFMEENTRTAHQSRTMIDQSREPLSPTQQFLAS